MSTPSYARILVGKQRVGIIGLEEALKDAVEGGRDRPVDTILETLMTSLSRSNFIPESTKERYRTAFLREYRKFIGEAVDEGEGKEGLQVRILGPGCPNCEGLERLVVAVLAEMGIPADVEHVRNPLAISEYGVFGTPALVVNGQVKSVGKVPSREVLKKIFSKTQRPGGFSGKAGEGG